ncbi:5-formyltetrahydrofolate cyclo-ligase [Halovulum dunhuangense]|uniref:5-formyltetrahydrofolate cyclo-ligase n=1 Tax=Halovulum dunhuangense TaxID=1505036 RepID=A0A849L3L9_9RHOB|nr:5-formyltetrahydrofolate cyclo-ligase [Halovulum dunhuangense]
MPDEPKDQASPPCLAHEIDPAYFDPQATDPRQASDVARWRKAERARLTDLRRMLSQADRAEADRKIAANLRDFLQSRLGALSGRVLSAYWPIKGEPDLRPLFDALRDEGVTIVLPVVVQSAAPLEFRRWDKGATLIRGTWNIPEPPPEAEVLTPDVALAPVVGWDRACFRLGNGGGYFDRTLAALDPRPLAIGIGLEAARLPTIFPQPHDLAMDAIVTEAGTHLPA